MLIKARQGQAWVPELEWQDLPDGYTSPNRPLAGRAVAVLGGGPSLTPSLVDLVTDHPTICTNNAFYLMREPTLVVALDRRWYEWHGKALSGAGHTAVTARHSGATPRYSGELKSFKKDRNEVWPINRYTLPGKNSGHAAIALAFTLGARAVYLIGFDMTFKGERTHWHQGHLVPSSQGNYEQRFRPDLEAMAVEAKKRGLILASLTETAADIPVAPLQYALEDLADEPNRMDYAQARPTLSE